MAHSILLRSAEIYWVLLPNRNLNSDTLLRASYVHYASAFYLMYAAFVHGLELHYDWKPDLMVEGIDQELSWWDEAFANELGAYTDLLILMYYVCWFTHPEIEPVTYELFMWGDVGFMNDIRFYSVAPHWYFRPLMAWLLVCPINAAGIFGLLSFFLGFYFQSAIIGYTHKDTQSKIKTRQVMVNKIKVHNLEVGLGGQLLYFTFLMTILYTASFLPYGRFYNKIGGNNTLTISYIIILLYPVTPAMHANIFTDAMCMSFKKWLYSVTRVRRVNLH